MLEQAIFTALAAMTVICALGVVLVRNVVHGTLLLGLCLTMVGGLYALLGADFIFAAQILIYVGAIAILFLFVVLLSGRKAEITDRPFNRTAAAGALSGAIALMILAGVIVQSREALRAFAGESTFVPTTPAIGETLLGPYAPGMEILGLVLLIALVGAVLLSKGLEEPPHNGFKKAQSHVRPSDGRSLRPKREEAAV